MCSSDDTRAGMPTYGLTLHADVSIVYYLCDVQGVDGPQDLNVVCDYLHLQDITASLKNAIKQIERTTRE